MRLAHPQGQSEKEFEPMKSILSYRTFSGAMALALGLGVLLPACADQAKAKPEAAGGTQVLAVVDGKPITDADVRGNAAAQFTQLERDYEQQKYQLLQGQLEQMIQDRLLDAEAATRKVTKEQLLADLKPAAVTDAAVDAFYEENKARIPQPKEQVAGQIKQYLEQRGQFEVREKLFKELEGKYKVETKLEPMRTEVAATGPAKGPESAPVTIVEFSDFQCPFCARLIPTLDQVKEKYGDKVRVVFRQFPLAMHAQAQKAAEASLCANEQGKFWELHDAMFKNQQQLAVENLKAKAAEMGLKAETFNSCLDSGKYQDQVAKDLEAGTAAGVSGTPALFINGRFINGAVPIEQITEVVDDELKRKGA
jgi:protein-disulfide isomerase